MKVLLYPKGRRALSSPPATRAGAVNGPERDRLEFKWLALHPQQYAGRRVALDGDRLLAVGDSAHEVYSAIGRRKGVPLVTYVESENEPHFAGW